MPETSTTTVSFNHAVTASAKAIAKDATLTTEADDAAVAVKLGLPTPEITPGHTFQNLTAARAISDTIAVVAANHDENTHQHFAPISPLANSLFCEMERIRCECLGAKNRLGITKNLYDLWKNSLQSSLKVESKQLKFVFSWLTKNALKETVHLTASQQNVLSKWQDTVLNSTNHLWPLLSERQFNQGEYAKLSLAIISTINQYTSNSLADTTSARPSDEEQKKETDQDSDTSQKSQDNDETDDNLASVEIRDNDNDDDDVLLAESSDTKLNDDDVTKNRDAPVDADSQSNDSSIEQTTCRYKSYSNTYDEVVPADSLCNASERQDLRELLDGHIERHSKVVGKLAGQLQRALMAQQNRHWKFDLEEGVLDTSRLTRIVTQPYSGLSFKQESDIEFKNTTVTLLVDNSKSMLGKPIAIAAACADILAQTLERCGVTVEILGFTTTELHGGALFDLWKKQGKSSDPGRLNGLRHIVYKSADVPYRRAREGFGVMLHKELLKQNIDGEALLWANERLQRRPEERKILLVISDGAPIDTSTMSANKDNYLIDHLHEVIEKIERNKNLQLAAIGIGHDVSSYYKRAVTIRDAKDLGKTLLTQLRSVIAPPDRLRRKQGSLR